MIEDFVKLIPDSLLAQSGSVFYSGRNAFGFPSQLYLLGLNPGGSPETQARETVALHTDKVLRCVPPNWSEYQDEQWKGKARGTCGMQPRVLHLLHGLGLDPRRIPSSNVVFVRSTRGNDLKEFRQLAEDCWPFHQHVIDQLKVKVIVCFGQLAGKWVSERLSAREPIGEFVENNNRRWRSSAFVNRKRIAVVVATHPSVAKWTVPASDPTPLVKRIMARY